jgi:FAD:protein FMN transferase
VTVPALAPASAGLAPGSASWRALGTRASVLVTEPAHLDDARTIVAGVLDEIDVACSRFRDDSELTRVNRSAGAWTAVGPLFLEALDAALRAARLTAGDVDPTIGRALRLAGYDRDFDQLREAPPVRVRVVATPGWRAVERDPAGGRVMVPRGVELDFGATAKALAADLAAAHVAAWLPGGVLVNLGGDIAVAGAAPPGGWRVRVTDDHAAGPEAPGETVTVSGGGLATSSTTTRTWATREGRQHHVFDPRTGRPAEIVWRTVSVAAGSCVDANTASTAAIVRGAAAPAWLESGRLPARLVRRDGSVLRVAGWPEPR